MSPINRICKFAVVRRSPGSKRRLNGPLLREVVMARTSMLSYCKTKSQTTRVAGGDRHLQTFGAFPAGRWGQGFSRMKIDRHGSNDAGL